MTECRNDRVRPPTPWNRMQLGRPGIDGNPTDIPFHFNRDPIDAFTTSLAAFWKGDEEAISLWPRGMSAARCFGIASGMSE
jgi:hypothetical protein